MLVMTLTIIPIVTRTPYTCVAMWHGSECLHLADSTPDNHSSESADIQLCSALHVEIPPEINLPSLSDECSGGTVYRGPLFEPDPPPDDVTLSDDDNPGSDTPQTDDADDVMNAIMNKPDDDVSIKDVLLAIKAVTDDNIRKINRI